MKVKLNNKEINAITDALKGIADASIAHGSWSAKMSMKDHAEAYLDILNMVKDAMDVLYLWNNEYGHEMSDIKLLIQSIKDER